MTTPRKKKDPPKPPKLSAIRCVSSHEETLSDSRSVEPGGYRRDVDLSAPRNARLLSEQRIIEVDPDQIPDESTTQTPEGGDV